VPYGVAASIVKGEYHMQLKREAVLIAATVLLAGALLLHICCTASSQSASPQTPVGRYQMSVVDLNTSYVIDTTTGQTWRRGAHGDAPCVKQAPLPH